ncbi:hypothetical protein AB0B66_17375 [Catellatospora sp. NPDC049111]|uniref:hypothetical protein n=1 Tax=Catellatospora sp. NPDC049111 TaxID=3155271 RepID=UPI003401C335
MPTDVSPQGLFGDVYNYSSYKMVIAKWDNVGGGTCKIWNQYAGTTASSKTVKCTTRDVSPGGTDPSTWDTDLFTLVVPYSLSIDGVYVGVKPANTYTRIQDNQIAECYTDQDGTYCLVTT